MKRVGLTLGKYAPLHKGHQYIFERMLAENDEAVVIIYDTDVTPIPLPVRAGWIRKLYPSVRVIEAWGSPAPPDWAEDERGWTGITKDLSRNSLRVYLSDRLAACKAQNAGVAGLRRGFATRQDDNIATKKCASYFVTVPKAGGGSGVSVDEAVIRAYEASEEMYVFDLLVKEGLAYFDKDSRRRTEITGFYSSEYYGAHMAEALGCEDVRVDEARAAYPVSSRMIRADSYGNRQFIDPLVYRDLIVKAVFVGSTSTGKSTLTEALAKRYGTTFSREYGRDYWTEHQKDRRIGLEEFDIIAKRHQELEEEAFLEANRVCFVDTNAITTYVYSLDYHGKATEYLTRTALENASRYDLFFLCEDDIPYDDTWDRSGDAKRHIFHRQVIADLEMRRIPYIRLSGSLEERMRKVDEVLSAYEPYRNFFGGLK